MPKVKIKPPLRQITWANEQFIRCPRCGYDCHRVMGAATTDKGIDPNNIELECGRCEKPFYVFLEAN